MEEPKDPTQPEGAPAAEPASLGFHIHLLRHSEAITLALLGGLFGTLGAFFQEAQSFFLVPYIAAPIIEELLKPAGVYVLLARYPKLLRSQLHTAVLATLGGLSFAIVENVVYLSVYFPDHPSSFVLFRFTVPLSMHMVASFILGFGINQRLLASVKGEIPLLAGNKRFFITAILLHALYNIGASVWSVVFHPFEEG